MRKTEVSPEEVANDVDLQERLDAFWDCIEDNYGDEWRVEYSGAIVLNVDEAFLTRVLSDYPIHANMNFGAREEHNPEERKYEWVNFPEDLIGLYSITGIYSNYYTVVDGPRTYFFEQA